MSWESSRLYYTDCLFVFTKLFHRPCNPSFTIPELVQHLRLSKSGLIITHVDFLSTVCAAAREVGLSTKRIIVLLDQDSQSAVKHTEFVSVDDLIAQGLKSQKTVEDVKLAPGEGKERIAFYSSSSGTTGAPKVCRPVDSMPDFH